MIMKIAQDFEYQGEDWWEWSVWIEGPEEELNEIGYIEYTLHQTYPKPVRKVSNRATNFRLQSAGWGCFTIYAKLFFKDGKTENLEHQLKLYYPDGRLTLA